MKKIGLIVGIVVTVAAMSLFAGCQAGGPSKSAEETIKAGIQKLAELKSGRFEASIKADVKDPAAGSTYLDLSVGGLADLTSVNTPKLVLKLNGNMGAAKDENKVGAEVRLDNDMVYFNVTEFAVKAAEMPKEISDLFKKWWFAKVPAEIMDQIKVDTTGSTSASGTEQTSAEQQKMVATLADANLFSKPTLVGTESVMGEPSWHYSATLDKANLITFMKKVSENQGQTISESELKKAEDSLKKIDITADIWVGTTSGYANQFKASVKMVGGENEQSGTIAVSVGLGDMNKTLSVDKPAGAEEFTEAKMGVIMSMFGGVPATTGGEIPTGDYGSSTGTETPYVQ